MKAGFPGAPPSNAVEGVACTLQRVWAALGAGSASTRSSNMVTPDVSAANARRRLAVRSRARGLCQSSITATQTEGERTTSTAARSNAIASGSTANTILAGSSPISANPGA